MYLEVPAHIEALGADFVRLWREFTTFPTREEAAAKMRVVTARTLANLDSQGRGPAGRLMIASKVCYPKDELVVWYAALTKSCKGATVTHINFDDFRRRAESDPVSFIQALQPGGRYDAGQREYSAARPQGGEGRSCKTSLKPGKMFVGRDFADSGQSWSGPIDLACAVFDVPKNQPQEAIKRAADRLGWSFVDNEFRPRKAPNGSTPDFIMGGRKPSLVSTYCNPDGSTFCHVVRGEAVRIDRRNSDSIILDEPSLTLILSAQPEILSGLAQTASFRGRGLVGRLLFLPPKSWSVRGRWRLRRCRRASATLTAPHYFIS